MNNPGLADKDMGAAIYQIQLAMQAHHHHGQNAHINAAIGGLAGAARRNQQQHPLHAAIRDIRTGMAQLNQGNVAQTEQDIRAAVTLIESFMRTHPGA
jgi:hypothetical protein